MTPHDDFMRNPNMYLVRQGYKRIKLCSFCVLLTAHLLHKDVLQGGLTQLCQGLRHLSKIC